MPTIIYTSHATTRRAAAIAAGAIGCVESPADLHDLVNQAVSQHAAPSDDWRASIELALRSMGAEGTSVLDRVANIDRNPATVARALLVNGREPEEGHRRLDCEPDLLG